MACITGPCQFLFDKSLLEGPRSCIQLIGDKRVLLRFSTSYKNGLLHDHLMTVDPGRVKPYDGNPMPDYHEVCLTFTDHKSRWKRNLTVEAGWLHWRNVLLRWEMANKNADHTNPTHTTQPNNELYTHPNTSLSYSFWVWRLLLTKPGKMVRSKKK